MTTIAALNVRLGMDASNFSQGVNLARGEVSKVTQIMRQSVPNTERLKSSLDLLNRSFSDTGKQTKQYANAVDFLNKKYGETEKAIGTQNRLIEGAKRLAAAWLGFQGAKSIVTIAADIEATAVQFEVLTGSAEKAKNLMADMVTFNQVSPLSLGAIQQGGKTLLTFGVETEKVMGIVEKLGAMTGGNAEKFKMLTLAYSQTSAAGKLMGQDLNQMKEHGLHPLKLMAEMTGQSFEHFQKMMEEGKFTIEMVNQTIEYATGVNGRFNGMNERMGKTATGAYNQMMSSIEELAGVIGADFLPYLAATANAIEKVVRSIMAFYSGMTATQKSILAGVVTFGALAVGIRVASAAMAAFTIATKSAAIGQAILLSLSGPKGWALLAAGAVAAGVAIYGIYKAYNQVNEAAKQTEEQAQVMKGTFASLAASVDSAISASIDSDRRRKKEFNDSLAALGAYSEAMAGLQQEIIKLKYTEDELYEIRLRSQGLNDVQVAQVKVLRDQVKELERKKQLGEEFAKSQEDALAAAKQFFDAEKRAEEERRQRAIQGPGTAEVGSSEAAKIIAEAFNRDQQAKAGRPKEPGQKEFIAKAQELLIAEAENRKKQEELMRAMKKATDTMLDTRAKLFRN